MTISPEDLDQDFIREAMPAFISEAQEQIESVEQLLLQLEDNPGDEDLLNALFRCAHTVKGSAGVFGLEAVVAFTHHVEGLLDQMREGHIALTPALSTLLLECNDQIRILVEAASSNEVNLGETEPARQALVQQLQEAAGASAAAATDAPTPEGGPAALPSPPKAGHWHVSVRFGVDTFRNGMDPWAIIAYLQGLGQINCIVHDDSAVPALEQLDPESCYMAFEFGLQCDVGREAIESAFSFVREDCVLHVIEPGAQPALFTSLLQEQPERARLGEILLGMGVITPHQLQASLRKQAVQIEKDELVQPLGDILEADMAVPARAVEAAVKKQKRDGAPAEDGRFIRVQADRLDAVINLLGELVVAGAGASLLARGTRQTSLIEANAQMGRLIEEIRNGTLQLRMVPIGETFSRFRRVVRDTAAALGKDVALEIQGGETELDKSMVERIADPLMHLVRNALDHGLETPQEREAAGKSPQGKLVLSACHESGSVLIRIQDDGRGINREKVLARAWERDLVEKGVTPADADILKLIFEPGFSTAEKVTNLSGRGVGMDVVRKNIEALRGTVQISSPPHSGTLIEIRLPLTLAIIDGFLVGVGDSKFIFPLESVVEVVDGGGQARLMESDGRCCMELRGQVLPVMNLYEVYGLDCMPTVRSSVVVIKAAGVVLGVLVDTLLGHHQTVIKPLSRMFRSLRGISGSSILGNGEVALIFDVNSLGELAAAEPFSRPLRETSSPSVQSIESQE